MHCAIDINNEAKVRLLLAHGANVSILNNNEDTALDIARANNRTNLVEILEEHIANQR